jgi:hypothetical protein
MQDIAVCHIYITKVQLYGCIECPSKEWREKDWTRLALRITHLAKS